MAPKPKGLKIGYNSLLKNMILGEEADNHGQANAPEKDG